MDVISNADVRAFFRLSRCQASLLGALDRSECRGGPERKSPETTTSSDVELHVRLELLRHPLKRWFILPTFRHPRETARRRDDPPLWSDEDTTVLRRAG